MTPNLTIVEAAGVLRVSGRLDIYAADSARAILLEHLGRSVPLHLDLTAVDSCDTAGAQLLCSFQKGAAQSGQPLGVELSPAIRDCCASLGLSPALFSSATV
jgi:anti-anti-sigma regulatory factor